MIHELFPSFIYQDKALHLNKKTDKALHKQIEKECYIFAEQDQKGQDWSSKNYLGGYTSYASLPALQEVSPTFADLKSKIDLHVQKYIKSLEMDIHFNELVMTSFWINIMPSHVVHTGHIHPLSTISGTYYVSTPKNSSPIQFEDPRLVAHMASPPRKANAKQKNQRFFKVAPQEGELVLFESWMRHEVPPNPANSERVSVSFNYEWLNK